MNKNEQSLYDKYLEQMKLIQDKTGIPGTYVIGALLAAIIFVWIGFLERIITNLVGTIYPAFWTMKSIESKSDDDKHWLTYWVVFAFFTIIDMFSGFILKFIPFYFFFKICFLIWLFMPNSTGLHLVYNLLIVRVFKTFEKDIDNASSKIGDYTKDLITEGSKIIEKKRNDSSTFKSIAGNVVSTIVGNVNVTNSEQNEKVSSKDIKEIKIKTITPVITKKPETSRTKIKK